MRAVRSLPSSKFRLIAVSAFAALAISPTVLGLNAGSDATSPTSDAGDDVSDSPAPTTLAPTTTIATDPSTTVPTSDPEPVEADPMLSATSDAEPTGEVEVITVVGDAAPVSGVPVVVGTAVTPLACEIGDTEQETDGEVPEPATADAGAVLADATAATEGATETPEGITDAGPAASDGSAVIDPSAATTTMPPTSAPTEPSGAAATGDGFDAGAVGWVALSGTWGVTDGRYVQSDETGYDFITQYPGLVPAEFAVSVSLSAVSESLGGGIVVAQPVPGSRRGATLIDFTDGGRFLRWGRYDADTGQYQYVGGVPTGDAFDPSAPHRLTVEVRSGRTLAILDGAALGEFGPVGAGGVGLATSLSAVAFDDFQIVEL